MCPVRNTTTQLPYCHVFELQNTIAYREKKITVCALKSKTKLLASLRPVIACYSTDRFLTLCTSCTSLFYVHLGHLHREASQCGIEHIEDKIQPYADAEKLSGSIYCAVNKLKEHGAASHYRNDFPPPSH